MNEIFEFLEEHRLFFIFAFLINLAIVQKLASKLQHGLSRNIQEAKGGRTEKDTLYKKSVNFVKNSIQQYEKREKKLGLYVKAKGKMKKAGYRSAYAGIIYISVKFVIPVVLFVATSAIYYPDFRRALIASLAIPLILEIVVFSRKKELSRRFDRYIYKVYKYLHNQISSGVKVSDAIKTVHYVIEDNMLKKLLIHLAASYELTNDIYMSLDEFRSNFDNMEAETLCVALQQGVETGDNQELLARQEQMMFNKYFNYIQAETENCKTKSVISVALFTIIIVIMLLVPLFNDMMESIGKIFSN